ncbi:hypothetical protein [Schinkia azotoformans]|uniref:hypothetical protein n=2 Tax=Schinkia azotoformans TaxID=1454 RepID=UPI002E24CB61|nr:hypothetical protein [Schinkia azotoformans]MED4420447.1 hypothetical protein [Schinkia azotoformans]
MRCLIGGLPYTRKDGTKKATRSAKYRCSGKAHQKVKCSGQTTYSPTRIEGVVLEEIYAYLDQLKTVDLTSQIEKLKKQNMSEETKALRKYKKEIDKANSDLTGLKNEVIKVINGESSFDRDMLSEMINDKQKEISELNEKIEQLEQQLESKKVEHAELEALQKHVPVWREVFKKASIEQKKMMLSTIIKSIDVYKDRIELNLNLHIREFLDTMDCDKKNIPTNWVDSGKVLSHNSLATL